MRMYVEGDTTRVQSGEVHRIGESVLQTADRIARTATDVYSWCGEAEGALAGSEVCNPLAFEVASFWRDALEGVAEEVRWFGSDIHAAATAYEAADDTAGSVIRQAGG